MEARSLLGLKIGNVLVGISVLICLYLSSLYSYLLFHSIAEVFSISVAGTVFMVSWNTRRAPDAGYYSFLGIGFLFVGGIGFLHLLAYKGMGVFPGYDANLPTQLWISSRYLLAATFLAAPAFAGRGLNHRLALTVCTAFAAVLLASVFSWKIFPDCFIEGTGLTPFKKVSEYVVSGLLLVSVVLLGRKKERFDLEVLRILVSSVVLAACSGMAFTLYTDVYGISNLAGHFLHILSFYLVYRAIVATDLVRKHELNRLLHQELEARKRTEKDLLDAQRELTAANELLEERVKERTGELSVAADMLQRELVQRRKAEQDLASQAALLKSVVDSVWDGVAVADTDGKFLVFNPAGKRIVRQGATDTRPGEWADQYGLFLPDAETPCPTDRIPLVRAIGGESFDDSELFVRHGQGTEEGVWISCSGSPLKDAEGVIQGGVVVFRDITARKRTEETQRSSMAMLENIFSNIHLCVVYLDPEFNYLRVNKAYADACGYPPESFPGKNHFDIYPNAENEAIFRKVVENGEPFHVIAKPFEFPDHPEWGMTYWDWSLLPLKDRDGKVDGLVFCLLDVTERRRAEEDLALNEERFRSLVTGSMVGILILRNGRIAYMNPEQKRLFGDLPENFMLREFPDVHPEDRGRFKTFCDSVQSEEGGPLDIDLRFYPFGRSPAGVDLRWVHCRATSIPSQGERTYLVNMMDISRLKEMEHQVMIREKLASLGSVSAGIAHEIRSPLSGINIYLAALQQVHGEAEGMTPEARDQAAEIVLQIQSAAQRIESVIKKVMDFTRPAAPRKELVDVGLAVENAIDFTAANLRKSGITLNRSRLVPLPKCSADPYMITQVMMNLISNAVQAMDDTGGSKLIEISTAVEDGQVVLRVSDSGPGIPPAIRGRIFDPFYTTRKDGYGIGLSFCRRVIEDHAGSLEVADSRWGGAEFRIAIPLPKVRSAV